MSSIAAAPRPASKNVEIEDIAKTLYTYANGDPELKEVIDVAALLAFEQHAPIKHDDIADLIGISVREVRKPLARLEYRHDVLSDRAQSPSITNWIRITMLY